MTRALTGRCLDCHCGGVGYMTLADLSPGKHDGMEGETIARCYCLCHNPRDTYTLRVPLPTALRPGSRGGSEVG